MVRNDRKPGSGEKGLSIKRPIVSNSSIIKADKDKRILYTVASMERKGLETKAAKIGNH